jgi:hypothetical protein
VGRRGPCRLTRSYSWLSVACRFPQPSPSWQTAILLTAGRETLVTKQGGSERLLVKRMFRMVLISVRSNPG